MILGIFESVKSTINILVVILSVSFLAAQNRQRDYDEELRYQNEAINALKDEIQTLRAKIKKTESQERSTIRRISTLDEEVALITRLIQSLRKEEGKTRDRIEIFKKDLQLNEQELEVLRIRYEQRVVKAFMQGRLTDLEKVLSSTSSSLANIPGTSTTNGSSSCVSYSSSIATGASFTGLIVIVTVPVSDCKLTVSNTR